MPMKKKYNEIGEFVDDAHECLSIKQLAEDLGIYIHKDLQATTVKCCFHDDDSPSLQISNSFFRCYAGSCGVRGDIFQFLQTYYNLTFIEAVRKLAEIYNIDVSNIRMKFDGRVGELKKEWAYYLSCMDNAPDEAREFIRDFFPQEVGYDKKEMYVVLPLTSKTGTVLGFTKRRVDKLHEKAGFMHEDEKTGKMKFNNPKWKHSNLKDSLIGQCHNVFNLANATPEIRKTGKVIVNEGPKDVIAWQRCGMKFAVGVCGTTNSNNIWDVILPVTDIYLSMDGDNAGIVTVISDVLYLVTKHDISHIHTLQFPDGMDPYDVISDPSMGIEKLKDIYEHPMSAIDFLCIHGRPDEIVELYEKVPEYSKIKVMTGICKNKHFTPSEAESWIDSIRSKGTAAYKNQSNASSNVIPNSALSERDQLIQIIRGNGDGSMLPDKAARILKMKYGVVLKDL